MEETREKVADILESINFSYPPLVLGASFFIAVASLAIGPSFEGAVLAAFAVGLAFIGGVMEIYYLVLLRYARDMARGSLGSLYGKVAIAAVLTGLYYTLVGIILLARESKSVLEYVKGTPIEDTVCKRYYRPVLSVLTVGLALSLLQECTSNQLALALRAMGMEEGPVGLSSEGYEGEEDSGGSDGLV
ncbi:MAG: hypothetical protein GSR85_02170 [Desulfurococcales archaeon]|nr:hypothetical protein [Desulfurococcales archaeon]